MFYYHIHADNYELAIGIARGWIRFIYAHLCINSQRSIQQITSYICVDAL